MKNINIKKSLVVLLLIGLTVMLIGCSKVYEEDDYVPGYVDDADDFVEDLPEKDVVPELIDYDDYVEIGEMI